MALELTPVEIVRLVQGLRAVPELATIANEGDALTFWRHDEHTRSMLEKVQAEGDREDVKKYIEENY